MGKRLSIYELLQGINIIVFFSMIYVFVEYGSNRFINENSIWINSIQVLLSFFVLKDAARNNNHLLAVLAFVMIVHFQFRIVTLNYTEYSVIFDERVPIDAGGINHILVYVIISYFLTWIGCHYLNKKRRKKLESKELFKSKATRNVLILLYSVLFLSVLSSVGVPGITQIVGILATYFLNLLFVMLFGIGYFLYRWDSINKTEKIFFAIFIILYILIFAGIGKRSSFYSVVIMLFFCMLAFNKIYLKVKYVFLGIAMLPLLLWFFSYSTFTRQNNVKTLNIRDAVEMTKLLQEEREMTDMRMVLTPVFNRIGFFDFTVEMVHNSDHLSQFLTPSNYLKSVVDNLLTPGFDIFDMPKMSCVITPSYFIHKIPSKKSIDENYQSDATSWYGEAYLLFGEVFALPIIFLVGYYIKEYYILLNRNLSLKTLWKRSIVLYLLYTLLYSYGLDWWLIYIVSFVINYLIFSSITIRGKNKKTIQTI